LWIHDYTNKYLTMKKVQLKRSIQSIGMQCFIKYFESFGDEAIREKDLIDALIKIEKYRENGARTRVCQSRKIFRENMVKEALELVGSSCRVKPWVTSKANLLLKEYGDYE